MTISEKRKRQREAMRAYRANPDNRAKINERSRQRARERWATDSAYRERRLARAKKAHKKRYWSDPETAREKGRNAAKLWRERHPEEHRRRHAAWKYAQLVKRFGPLDHFDHDHCAICRVSFGDTTATRRTLDHDHATGKARGFVCHRCNVMLGNAQDRPDVLRRAARYLQGR